jgi:hypothetical protein
MDDITAPDDDHLESRRADQKRALAEYAARLEVEKRERRQRGDAGRPSRRGESAEDKALQLLLEGAVGVTLAQPGRVEALVEGDTTTHRVGWSDIGSWSCDCEASVFRRSCSHIRAVRRVVRLTTKEEQDE